MGVTMKTAVPKMDLKSKANNQTYLKTLIVSKKELAILKLIEILPFIHSSLNDRLKITYMKIFPVMFSFAELNRIYIEECLLLIAKIKKHPFFIQEKSLFDSWQTRLRNLSPNHESPNKFGAIKYTENTFINIPGTNMYDIIGYAELDLFFRYHKWLKYHKLHKYLYFFANLSYVEIQSINAENIRSFEDKVDLYPMTDGARNAIIRKLAELNQRPARLEIFSKKEYFTNVSKVEKSIYELKIILRTPIRSNQMFCHNNLPDLLSRAIETVVFMILRLPKDDLLKLYEPSVSLLKMAWGCSFFETDVKNKLNLLQHALHSKLKSYSKKMKDVHNNRIYIDTKDVYTVHFDIESGIRAITWYLENVVLRDF